MYGSDVVCWGHLGCTDPNASNYDRQQIDDGSCTYASSTSVTLTMVDSWGDGWNGNTFVLTNSVNGIGCNDINFNNRFTRI